MTKFSALDIVLIMMEQLFTYSKDHLNNFDINRNSLKKVKQWFDTETTTWKEETDIGAGAQAGIDFDKHPISWFSGAFAKLTAHVKYASNRSTTVIE